MQLPAYLANRTQAPTRNLAAELLGNLGTGSPPYISIRNNKFTAVDATGTEKPIGGYSQTEDQFGAVGVWVDVVMADVNEHTSKVWFDKAFSDDQSNWLPPSCWSDNGIGPSRGCSSPQARTCQPDSTNTFGCSKAAWGSAIGLKGGQTKACKDIQKMAFVVPGDEIVYQFRLPPNSRTNLRDYMLQFKGQPFDIGDVLTRVWFDQQTIGTLKFKAVGFMNEATVAQRDKALAEKRTDMLVGRGDMPVQQALPAPTAPAQVNVPANTIPQVAPPVQQAPAMTPFAPAASPPSMPSAQQPAPQQAMPAGPAPSASPSEPPRQRRRRNTAQAPEGQPAQPAQQTAGAAAMAPFMPQAQPAPAAQPGNGAQFGIQQPAPASDEVTNMLSQLFPK